MYNNSPIFKWNILMRCADAQNLVSSHASLPDWRGSQGNKLMRETNQDFAAWIESEKMAEKKIKKVSASAASRWVLELDVKKQWLNYSEEAGYVTKINCTLCSKYQDKLKYLKNFSTAMITGITGSSIKKDNVKKHATSDAHVVNESLWVNECNDIKSKWWVNKVMSC